MNPKTYSPVPVRGQNLWAVAMLAGTAGFLFALATHTSPTIPVWAMFGFASFDVFSVFVVRDFRGFKNPSLIKAAVFSFMQILTCVAILASVIIGDMSKGSEWLWGIVMFLFIYFGVLNIAETVHLWKRNSRLRANERKLASQSAIIDSFKRMGREDELVTQSDLEALKRLERQEEARKVENSLLESLAFLADIDPKNK